MNFDQTFIATTIIILEEKSICLELAIIMLQLKAIIMITDSLYWDLQVLIGNL